MNRANYRILEDEPGKPLLIQDMGPWDVHASVTNDADLVVAELSQAGKLPAGRRLFYIDSDGQKDELLHQAGRFLGFSPGPQRSQP
jgi:hypothetical protein